MFLSLALLALVAACFGLIGLYYVFNARQLSAMFVQSILKMPRVLQFIFPIRWYKSEASVWLNRLGGIISLAVSAGLFGYFLWEVAKLMLSRVHI